MTSISDKEFYHLTISINKALNITESPLKIKHARSVIITTHRTKETKSFWSVVTRQPLMENRFTAWKFCHLLHKVLREGHGNALKHSQSHKKLILEMGKLWGHLQDGLGNCIQAYSKLIVTKLDFHGKNELFPGSLVINFLEIEKFAGDDINIYFQLCVEIFDYLFEIIDVQQCVFSSINTYRMSSMTPQGQCRLAPLITLIQDSNPLYDLSVRVMFKLHDELPNDVLSGHRDRFYELFSKIKHFYDNVRPLQYFTDLIQVPLLPEIAPNFTSKIDFGSYVPPVVYVQPDPEPAVDNLIDTSIVVELPTELQTFSETQEVASLKNIIREKEIAIEYLLKELNVIKDDFNNMESNNQKEVIRLNNETCVLINDLAIAKEMYTNMKFLKDELELQSPTISLKTSEEIEKIKATEEKFAKLKIMYAQIRDEHINLLRQSAESTKLMNKEKYENSELQISIRNLEAATNNLKEELKTKEKKITELKLAVQDMTTKYDQLVVSHDQLEVKFVELNTIKCLQIEQMTTKTMLLEDNIAELQQYKSKIFDSEKSLMDTHDLMYKNKKQHEIDTNKLKMDLDQKVNIINDLKKEHDNEIKNKNSEIEKDKQIIYLMESQLKENDLRYTTMTNEKLLLETEVQNLLKKNIDTEHKYKISLEDIKAMVSEQNDTKRNNQKLLSSLLECVLKTMEIISSSKFDEKNEQTYEKTFNLLDKMDNQLKELLLVYQQYFEYGVNSIEDLARKSIILGNTFTMLHEQCIIIYNMVVDIGKNQDIFVQINVLREPLVKLFQSIYNLEKPVNVEQFINIIKDALLKIRKILSELVKTINSSSDIENLVDAELKEMDKVIWEAAEKFIEMLSQARSKDNGIKLEVNEKILDACTVLMECIKLLIKKSKILQEEIVTIGQGTSSAKEFYKRNSQWTEGLISASKSVARGANLLVDAANKAVNSKSNKNFEIIVAAQEIAACTAQLVIASKVKAPRESMKLVDLTTASRNVSKATGAVVATVKDCNQHLEQSQEIDFSELTSSQAKTMEMEIIVKVLEFEQALQSERLKLSSFRKTHYQNNED